MKVESSNQVSVQGQGSLTSLGEVGIEAHSISKLFSIVTEKLYENPIRAITREMMTNMLDAWMQKKGGNGLVVDPGIVSLPDYGRLQIEFKDYGPGLSKEDIEKYVCKILNSSKDQGNEYHGGWGLGLKSPFAYTKNWTIQSRYQGKLYSYVTYMQENGIPAVDMVGSPIPTTEKSGLTITLPVQAKDTETFSSWAKWYATYFPKDAIHISDFPDPPVVEYDPELEGTIQTPDGPVRWASRTSHGFVDSTILRALGEDGEGSLKDTSPRIILGRIVYNFPTGLAAKYIPTVPIDIFFPIGSLQVTPDRDRLSAEEKQIQKLEKVLDQIVENIKSTFQEKLKTLQPYEILDKLLSDEQGEAMVAVFKASFPKTQNSYSYTGSLDLGDYSFDISLPNYGSPAYRPKKENLLCIRDLVKLADGRKLTKDHELAIRRRSSSENRQDTEKWYRFPTDVSQHSHPDPIQYKVTGFYYDDLGPGSLGRYKNVTLGDQYISNRRRYVRTHQSIYLISVRDMTKASNTTEPIQITDLDELAKMLGVPTDLVKKVSELPEPKKHEPVYVTRNNGSVVTQSRKDMNLPALLDTSPFVRKVHFEYEISSRDRLGKNFGLSQGGLYIPTHRGSTQDEDWPTTSAATINESWNFVGKLPGDLRAKLNLHNLLTIFLPTTYIQPIKEHGPWRDFFNYFRTQAFLWIKDLQSKGMDKKHVVGSGYRSVYDYTFDRVRRQFLALEKAAKLLELDLTKTFTKDLEDVKLYRSDYELCGQRTYDASSLKQMPTILLDWFGIENGQEIQDNNERLKDLCKKWILQYPALFTLDERSLENLEVTKQNAQVWRSLIKTMTKKIALPPSNKTQEDTDDAE